MASWVCYAIPSDEESYIGIPDKLLNECTELMDRAPANIPLTFRLKFNNKESLIGMTEFVSGNNIILPAHIMNLLEIESSAKVRLSTFRRNPAVLKQLHLKPLSWQFYDEGNHAECIEKTLRFFPTINRGSVLPVKFGSTVVYLQVDKLMDTRDEEVPYALIQQQEIRLEFESNDSLYKEYEQKLKERKHIAKMDSWNKVWEHIQQGRPVFGMTDELQKFIREKRMIADVVVSANEIKL